jgi:transcriptional regulator with XRE-family HTH domain
MRTEFETWLAEEMRQRSLNNSGLGRKIGVSGAAVSRWLRGVRQPDEESIAKLAGFLKVSPTEIYRLLGRLTDPPRDPYFEILESLWEKAPDWKKQDIVLQLRAVLQEQERERAVREARRVEGESTEDSPL